MVIKIQNTSVCSQDEMFIIIIIMHKITLIQFSGCDPNELKEKHATLTNLI